LESSHRCRAVLGDVSLLAASVATFAAVGTVAALRNSMPFLEASITLERTSLQGLHSGIRPPDAQFPRCDQPAGHGDRTSHPHGAQSTAGESHVAGLDRLRYPPAEATAATTLSALSTESSRSLIRTSVVCVGRVILTPSLSLRISLNRSARASAFLTFSGPPISNIWALSLPV